MTTAADLARTHAEAFRTARPWTEAEFATLLQATGTVLAGDARTFVLGRVIVDEAEILTVATQTAYQRQGLATTAMRAFEAALSAPVRSIFLEVAEDNTAARALYARLGFAQAGLRVGYYARAHDPAVDALILRKHIN